MRATPTSTGLVTTGTRHRADRGADDHAADVGADDRLHCRRHERSAVPRDRQGPGAGLLRGAVGTREADHRHGQPVPDQRGADQRASHRARQQPTGDSERDVCRARGRDGVRHHACPVPAAGDVYVQRAGSKRAVCGPDGAQEDLQPRRGGAHGERRRGAPDAQDRIRGDSRVSVRDVLGRGPVLFRRPELQLRRPGAHQRQPVPQLKATARRSR